MAASHAASGVQEIEFMALEGSLVMMSKGTLVVSHSLQPTNFTTVLNDMLDLLSDSLAFSNYI